MSLQQETGAAPVAQEQLAKRLELGAWEQVMRWQQSVLVTAHDKGGWGCHELNPRW